MLTTLSIASASALRNIAGSCPASPAFIQLLNDATRRLMRRGDWPGLVVPIHVCTRAGCVVWPRYVGTVRKINVCNQNVPIHNSWYELLPYGERSWGNQGIRANGNQSWWGNNGFGAWCGAPAAMVLSGKTPVFQDMLGEGRFVRAYATMNIDLGKRIRIFGTDNNGQRLKTNNTDGTQTEGVEIRILNPFGSTAVYVRHIDRILLDDMQGDVRLYGYNPSTDLLEDIGLYEPGDVNPAFERYKLTTGDCGTGSCGCSTSVVALVKLQYVPARYDNDLVLIDNLDALKLMMQVIKLEEAGDRKGARETEADAIRELNLDLNDQSPATEIPISVNMFNSVPIGRQQCF